MGVSVEGPVDDLVRLAFEEFDSKAAYKAYHRHLTYNSKNSIDRAFRALMPLFGVMHRQGKFHRHESPRVIDFVNYASFSLFAELRRVRTSLYGVSMAHFIVHFRRVIRGGVYQQIISTETTRIVDFGYNCKVYTCGSLITHSDVEAKMMLESIPSILWHKVCEDCRFKDASRRRICAYILGRFVHGKRPVLKVLKTHFGLSKEKAQFFEDYVLVAARRVLVEMRPNVLRSNEDAAFLLGGGPLDYSQGAAA
jgi:hypothetical protein